MNDIIHHFVEVELNKVMKSFAEVCVGDGNFSEFTLEFKKTLDTFGKKMCGKLLEMLNDVVRQEPRRLKKWVVEKKFKTKTITTVFGDVKYKRTYYKSKNNNSYRYLSDYIAGIDTHQRIDDAVISRVINSSTELSYERSGEEFNITKQTVMNKVRELNNIEVRLKEAEEKTETDILYIEADEDHVALQKGGCIEPKIVYIHEGYRSDLGNVKRKELKNVHYIAGVYKTEDIWRKALEYIEARYNMAKIKRIYISGDGANWIKSGIEHIPGSKFLLDRYHINSSILKATGHAKDVRFKLWKGINNSDKKLVKEAFKELIEEADSINRLEMIGNCKTYILGNWQSIKLRNANKKEIVGCSAEGHVSHLLSSRLSSRPLGWSRHGVDQMAKLRAFKKNSGNIYELIKASSKCKKRFQSKEDIESIINNLNQQTRENVVGLPAIDYGKRTPLYIQLNGLAHKRNIF